MKKIGLFGGTFNPPHIGHIKAALSFAKEMDFVYFMPSSIPPHKELQNGDSAAHRFNMTKLAFADIPTHHVTSALELLRKGKSYTVDTVRELIRRHKCDKIYLYVGSDMLFWFENWKDYRQLLEMCVIVTAPRDEESHGKISGFLRNFAEKYGCEYRLLPIIPYDISSTELRRDFLDGELKVLKNHLTDSVYEYIINNTIYGTVKNNDISTPEMTEEIRDLLPQMIDEKRLFHTLSVEKEALSMAKIYLSLYGYGEEYLGDISAAALLHDITKNYPVEKHIEYLSDFFFDIDFPESVLHSVSSAFFALERFCCNTRVFSSIYYHTTGCAQMDIFEKIIYLSDIIEPTRIHDSCKKLRRLFYERIESASNEKEYKYALDKTILDSFVMTKTHLEDTGRTVDRRLFEAIEYFEAELR